jgi:hypothetical protein
VIYSRFARRFLKSLSLVVGFFVGIVLTHLAAGLAVVWAGPLAGLAVYLVVVTCFVAAILTISELEGQ